MEIIQERIEREYEPGCALHGPSVEYEVVMGDGEVLRIDSPRSSPEEGMVTEIREPMG